jgi:glucose/arabinose dehydrogenase
MVAATAVLTTGAALFSPVHAQAAGFTAKVNFQAQTAPAPAGYSIDYGQAYSDTRGYGWVAQDSSTPLSLVGNGRVRNQTPDPRLDSFVHMQLTDASLTGVHTPGRWELAVPNGGYDVTVAVGDVFADSTNRLSVEGVPAITDFKPALNDMYQIRTVRATVTDGKLTLDAAGGTNTKLDYVDVVSAADTTAPVVTAVDPPDWTTSVASDAALALDFSSPIDPATVTSASVVLIDGTGASVAADRSLESASRLILAPTSPLRASTRFMIQVTPGLMSTTGASFTPLTSTFTTASGPFSARINFQTNSTTVAPGYKVDYGAAYTDTRGYGWIAQDSSAPLSLVGNGRIRKVTADKRLDSILHMQLTSASTAGVHIPGRWEIAVPAGTYDVTVAAGDIYTDSVHRLTVEGTVAIDDFVPTPTSLYKTATVRVGVTDGRLTIDAAGGTNTKIDYVDIDSSDAARRVVSVDPSDGSPDVPVTASVTVGLSHPVDFSTINSSTVRLTDGSGTAVSGVYNSDAAGALVTFTPSQPLRSSTTYTLNTTSGLIDVLQKPFLPFTSTFTTNAGTVPPPGFDFDRVHLADVNAPTVVTIGPDGKLYVGTGAGQILRYALAGDGTVTGPAESLGTYAFSRTITGMRFDPASTASDLRLWVSHSFLGNQNVANWQGKISLLTGADLSTVRDVIVGLPRSTRDHMNNGIDFGPDGKLYIAQGSLSGYGAPDSYWGNRPEAPLSAAILVADVNNDPAFQSTVDVNTSTGYNPNTPGAPVTVYASGTRNPFDLVWTASGLYVPVNESASGNAPAGPGGSPPALQALPAGRDFLAKIIAGGYYGHPNPSRGQYVLNGGNPTSGTDPFEVPQYPVGQLPDPNWTQPMLDLGLHRSADGITEYRSDAFGDALKGKLLMVEYSAGDDLVYVSPDNPGAGTTQLAVGLDNPLDVTSDVASGNIYVAEYGDQNTGAGGGVVLLRPRTTPLDTTPPTVVVTPAGAQGDPGYYHSAVSVAVTATDDVGVTSTTYSLDGSAAAHYTAPIDVTTDGPHQIDVTARDAAGNVATKSVQFAIDTVNPNASLALVGDQDPGTGQYTSSVAVTLTSGDAGSGVSSSTYNLDGAGAATYTGPVQVNSNGDHTLVATVVDKAGNSASASTSFTVNRQSGHISVSSPHDVLGLPSRLILSTVNEEDRPPQTLTVANSGPGPLHVTAITIAGPQASNFRLSAGQPTVITVPVGGTAPVAVEFRPAVGSPVENAATLTITSDDPVTPAYKVTLAALDSVDYEGANEPTLAQIVRTLGYTTNIASETHYISNNRAPKGDERISPYWLPVDPSKPMRLIPVARYIARTASCACSKTGWLQRSPSVKSQLFYFVGGTDSSGGPGNQRMFPSFVGGTSFNATSVLSFYSDDGTSSDDGRNANAVHDFRFYPAKNAAGVQIPNTWLVGYDTGTVVADKNFDYQDVVMLLTNASPELTVAPVPSSSSVKLDFSAAKAGTILDGAGKGTGFRSVQVNTAGNQYKPGQIALDTSVGVLRLTSDAGTFTGATNTQSNALEMPFDASRYRSLITARLVAPFNQINSGFDQAALYFGPDQDNYVKVEVENRSGVPNLTMFYEAKNVYPVENNGGKVIGTPIPLGPATGLNTIDLRIKADVVSGQLTVSYRVNSTADTDAYTAAGSAVAPRDVMRWFSTQGRAGIAVSNQGSTVPLTATYDLFRIDPA